MVQTVVGVACLLVGIVQLLMQYPTARLSWREWGNVKSGGGMTALMTRFRPLLPMTLSVVLIAVGLIVLFYRPRVATGPDAQKQIPAQASAAQPNVHRISTARPPKVSTKLEKKKSAPSASVEQGGNGNQQTVTQAPVIQKNSGGCNQQVIGGNGNINNCVPPSRILSDSSLSNLHGLLSASQQKTIIRVILASTADDVYPLSRQICGAAQDSGWGVACPRGRSSVMGQDAIAKGLDCYSSNWNTPDALAFRGAMRAAGLHCHYIPHNYDFGGFQIGGPGGITLVIGSPTE